MIETGKIRSPDDAALHELCARLEQSGPALDLQDDAWPREQLQLCGQFGVFEWFLESEWGGQDWSEPDVIRGYLQLSKACLTTTFIITQRSGACRRIAISDNDPLKSQLLPGLVSGQRFATVGISHLTTSRRHLAKPVLSAKETANGFILDGFSPWVTGAVHADTVVTGATLDDGRQILVALPTDLPGVSITTPAKLVGLSASQTGEVRCRRVEVPHHYLLAGPVENVMAHGAGAKTGGLQTSTLAIGLAAAALDFLKAQAAARPELHPAWSALQREWETVCSQLLAVAEGQPLCSSEDIRTRANSLVLRSTQAALSAAKGTGYVVGHPAGRWCREALFFLVWSCPQPVMAAHLCELAGIQSQ